MVKRKNVNHQYIFHIILHTALPSYHNILIGLLVYLCFRNYLFPLQIKSTQVFKKCRTKRNDRCADEAALDVHEHCYLIFSFTRLLINEYFQLCEVLADQAHFIWAFLLSQKLSDYSPLVLAVVDELQNFIIFAQQECNLQMRPVVFFKHCREFDKHPRQICKFEIILLEDFECARCSGRYESEETQILLKEIAHLD